MSQRRTPKKPPDYSPVVPSICIPYQEFSGLEECNSGGFATVYKATWRRDNGPVALKMLSTSNKLNKRKEQEVLKEANILLSLVHKNIIKIYGIIMEVGRIPRYGIVLEYMRFGSLSDVRDKIKLTDVLQMKIVLEIIGGMTFLHDHESRPAIIHRDLKLSNILIGDDLDVKIADFGISDWRSYSLKTRVIGPHEEVRPSTAGTTTHIPPEAWEDMHNVSEKFDVYAFGIMLWELFTGDVPYNGCSDDMICVCVKNGQRPDLRIPEVEGAHKMLRELMHQSWSQQPADRPRFKDMSLPLNTFVAFNRRNLTEDKQMVLRDLRAMTCSKSNEMCKQQPPKATEHTMGVFQKSKNQPIQEVAHSAICQEGAAVNPGGEPGKDIKRKGVGSPARRGKAGKKERLMVDDMEEKITQFLGTQTESVKSLAIAKAIGCTNAKDVNPTLYELEKQGITMKVTNQPPTWRLATPLMD